MQQYIDRIIKGDQEAFKVLFESFFTTLTNFARSFMLADDAAQDLSQEALLKYWQRRENFDNYNQVRSFLYLTVKNAALNEIQHGKVADVAHALIAAGREESLADWKDRMVEEEVLRQLTEAIARLPKRAAEIIRLSLAGVTNEEIAEKMGITRETVRSQKKIAHKKLRSDLEADK